MVFDVWVSGLGYLKAIGDCTTDAEGCKSARAGHPPQALILEYL
jgi:hypothetical protein